MAINLYEHQEIAIKQLHNGSILCGGVGTGKSRTALAYYFLKVCNGEMCVNGKGAYKEMANPLELYIITTAKKRDTAEWEQEYAPFLLDSNHVHIDSWNNVAKYVDVKDAFFIFDEQRVVGYGTWSKSFIKISRSNKWILLTATPGDTWMDYIPVFIANGFYKNKSDFERQHVIYKRINNFYKVDRYYNTGVLIKHRNEIMVTINYEKPTCTHNKTIICEYDKSAFKLIKDERWNVYTDLPIENISELCFTMRKCVNSDSSRLVSVSNLLKDHPKTIIFYNFDYELVLLKDLLENMCIPYSEWNGHKHEEIPSTKRWAYLVNYAAGAEGWNCIETDTIIFYSQNYSYKTMIQAAGRIDRLNTPFADLYYYHLRSNAPIDLGIERALKKKQKFNEYNYITRR